MKKLFFLFFTLLIVSNSWAEKKEKPPMVLGGGLAIPYAYERAKYNNETIETKMTSIGLNLTVGTLPKNNNWGVIDNFTFAFPQSISSKYGGNDYTSDKKDYKSLFLFETTIAFDYFFVNNDSFLLGVGPLLGMTLFSWSTDYITSGNYALGVGANIYGLKKITDKLGIQFGATTVFDFYGFGYVNTALTKNSYSGFTNDYSLTPFVGLSCIF